MPVASLIAAVALAAKPPARAQIDSLPGWAGALPSTMYNGWIDSGTPPSGKGTMYFHYWFIESERDPKNDPVLLWYNGGPGASSLFGLLVELGPLMLNDASLQSAEYNRTKIPQLIRNPYGWSQQANLLVVDNPPPVGFSYCDPEGPSGDGYSCGSWDDDLVAKANLAFLKGWFKAYPEYAGTKTYLSGESYAGIYVPSLAREIVQDPGSSINLAGFAVGDGCMGTEVLCGRHEGPFWNIEFLHGHGQFSNSLYNAIMATCSEDELKYGNLSAPCSALTNQVSTEVGSYYGYNLYDECPHDGPFMTRRTWGLSKTPTLGGALNDYPCPGNAMGEWLNRSDVRKALHVQPGANFFSGDNGVGFNYSVTEPNLLPFYKQAIEDPKLRVLVYNGDTDPGINSFVTQDKYFGYFDDNGVKEEAKWRPWTLHGTGKFVAGYVTKYQGNFSFVTIRGSGHMVPEFKPEAASVMINAFLDGDDYPRLAAQQPTDK